MAILILFGTLTLLVILSVPVGIAIGLSTMITIYFSDTMKMVTLVQKFFSSLDSFPLMAIPFFMLAGLLMGRGGISRRILDLASQLVGWMVGGLAMVTVVACTFFAALSGSGPATVAAIGSFMIPAMKAKNYSHGFASAITAAGGCIGVIIPPSIPLILYGVVSGASIGDLFKAGIIPGILTSFLLMVVAFFVVKKDKNVIATTHEKITFRSLLLHFYEAKWALLAPVIILGGIYGGIFTPTEAAVIAIIYSLFVGVFIHKDLRWKEIKESLMQTIVLTGATMYMVSTSIAFAYLLTVEQIPTQIAQGIASLSTNGIIILLCINLFLLLIGAFIDTIPAIAMLTPILLPIALSIGIDLVHFGVIMVMNLAIGFITPPFGINLFIASAVSKTPVEQIIKALGPILIAMLLSLLIVSYFPSLSMFLTKL